MPRQSVNSLKGKIWLSTGALAFFVCTFGIGSWLVVSLFTENSFYAAVIHFLFSAAAIVACGWWLSGEIARPIEKVSLLAKSLERGVSAALPKTSGSIETDELLETLHRNNQQLQNLVGLMDKVASGNLDVAIEPLEQSDRLSSSFQKLLAKVTESINAKRDLERLKAAIRQINEEIVRVRSGNLDVEIKTDALQTKEIAHALKFLIHHLNELIYHVKTDSKQTQVSAKEIQKILQTVIAADENRIREMNRATPALKQIPQSAQKISEELLASSHTAKNSITSARAGLKTARENLQAAGTLRGQIREAVKRVGQLGERTQEIGKIGKTVEDLAQRTNLIALNASIRTADADSSAGGGLVAFSDEIERLAARAADTNRQISALGKTVAAEIGEIERSLQDSIGEAANLSRFAIETGNSLSELEKYVGQFLNLQEKLHVFSGEQTADTELAFQSFVASIAETEAGVKNLKESETQIGRVAISMENLQLAVADFKTASPAVEKESVADFAEVPQTFY